MIGLIIFSEEILSIISGEQYMLAGKSLGILSVAIIFTIFANVYVNCILIPNQKEKQVLWISSLCAFTNIFLNIVLIPIYGIEAAAFTTVVAEALMCFVSYYLGKKYVKMDKLIFNAISVFVGCVFVTFICILVKKNIENLFIKIGLSFVLSVLGYGTIISILNYKQVKKIIEKNVIKICKKNI